MNVNATLLVQMIIFAIFVYLCVKFVWGPIVAALEERKKKIADGLNAADRAAKDLELAQENASKSLNEAKQQAAVIIEQANKRATQIIDESKAEAAAEGDRLVAAAKAEIEQEVNRAREELRARVAALAVEGAQKILQTQVDEKAHSELLDKLAADL
ncbi:F0F1 ATP synthase subunit B [Salinibius halmophilus]|uniref:F0F1 ATP synthase subunit B n=1 Tax=Salinibius halmophilus TaxID=1853216 RepID=UPI000E65FD6D|nr:F0F1 ATP synthase subunit B [Salinibius halmophilus]